IAQIEGITAVATKDAGGSDRIRRDIHVDTRRPPLSDLSWNDTNDLEAVVTEGNALTKDFGIRFKLASPQMFAQYGKQRPIPNILGLCKDRAQNYWAPPAL